MQRDTMTDPEAGQRLGWSRIGIGQARARLQESYNTAVNTLITIMNDEGAPSASRVIAANSVIEHALKPIE